MICLFMSTETLAPAAQASISQPLSFSELICNINGYDAASSLSYLNRASSHKYKGTNSLNRRSIGDMSVHNDENLSYGESVIKQQSSFSLPISCPPPSRLSEFEHSYQFYEEHYNLSTQSMYERISEARKNHNTVSDEETWKISQLQEGPSIYHNINDQEHIVSLGKLHDKLRDDEMFDLEL